MLHDDKQCHHHEDEGNLLWFSVCSKDQQQTSHQVVTFFPRIFAYRKLNTVFKCTTYSNCHWLRAAPLLAAAQLSLVQTVFFLLLRELVTLINYSKNIDWQLKNHRRTMLIHLSSFLASTLLFQYFFHLSIPVHFFSF